jgi:hypothetical protein
MARRRSRPDEPVGYPASMGVPSQDEILAAVEHLAQQAGDRLAPVKLSEIPGTLVPPRDPDDRFTVQLDPWQLGTER